MPSENLHAASGRRLPAAGQLALVAIAAVILIVLFFVVPALLKPAEPVAEAGAAQSSSQPGAESSEFFKPTAQQWAGFKIQAVAPRMFAPTTSAEGKIALDDDLTTPVISPYSGRVTRVFARAGDTVQAGSPLFTIEASELSQGENDLVSAIASDRTAHAQLGLAVANEARQHALYLGHGAALRDWQQSRVDLATAQGGSSSAKIALTAVRNRLRILGESDAAILGLESSGAPGRISAATTVRAPIAGTITQRQVGPGQNIVGSTASQGAAQPVFSIGDLTKVWLVANVRESDAPLVHVGDAAQVSVLAYPGRVFAARITYVAPGIDPVTHRLPVRAEVENTDRALKPEMFASFEIVTGVGAQAPAVPSDAVVYEGSDAHVWLADVTDKKLAFRAVTVGRTGDGMVEVTSGVRPGDHVVTSGAVFIDRAVSGG